MFTLVEPCVTEQLVDRPNLGCAMLLAACREAGIECSLASGQTAVLSLLAQLDPETPVGDERPLAVLRTLYEAVTGQRGPRPHLSGVSVARLEVVYRIVMHRLQADLEAGLSLDVPVVDDYVQRIAATGCDVVGFSLQRGFESLTREVRRRLRDDHGMTVIAGGPQVTRLRRSEHADTLDREHIDFLVKGPGESALPRLLEALAHGDDPAGIPNVYSRRHGEVVGFEETVHVDLDSLPFPDFDDVDFDALIAPERVIPVESARGCTWDRCAFCDHNAGPVERYAAWSIDRVVETLAHLRSRYRCHEFVLHDLELPARRARQLSSRIVAEGIEGLGLGALARFTPDYVDPGLWEEMRAAGFVLIEWGLESGSQRTLDSMRKGIRLDTASDVLRTAAAAGIANECFVLFGFPGETPEEAKQTVEFLQDHRAYITRTMIDVLRVQPHSPLGRDPHGWGLTAAGIESNRADGGLGRDAARAIARDLAGRESFDPTLFSDAPVRSVAKVNAGRVVHGMLRCHRHVPWEQVAEALTRECTAAVYPVVLGELRDVGGVLEWQPVASSEPPLVNLRAPRPARQLDDDETAGFRMADGTRSLDEIGTPGASSGSAADRRRTFVLESLRDGRGLAFGRRWEP